MKRVVLNLFVHAKLLALEVIACILYSLNAFSQNAMVGSGFGSGWGGACGSNSDFIYFSQGAGSSYTSGILSPNNTGNQYWRFGIDWGGTIKQLHTNNTGMDEIISTNTTYTLDPVCAVTGAMYLGVPNTAYSYIFKTKDAGTNPSNQFVVFEVQGPVQTINSVSQYPLTGSVTAGQAVTVTASLSGALSAGQAVYLRYSTSSNFISSTVVTMSGSGTTYSAEIPQAINSSGVSVYYYVFTSGNTNVETGGSNADFYSINLNNNSGSNYHYTVAPTVVIYNYTNNTTGSYNSITSNITCGNLSRVNGAAAPGTPCGTGFSTSNFSSTTSFINSLAAVELTITPSPGYILWTSSISVDLRRSNSGPSVIRPAYSTDGGSAWINPGIDWAPNNAVCGTTTSYLWNPSTFSANEANGLKIRLYGFNASGTTGVLQILNINITGTVIAADFYNPISSINISNNCLTTTAIQWTPPLSYNATNNTTLVFAKAGSAIITGTASSDVSTYMAGSSFGSGTTYENDPSAYCVYKGDAAGFNLSNLSPGSNYYLLAYNVLNPKTYSTAASTSFSTITTPSNISSPSITPGNGQLLISWSDPASCFDEVMIIATDNVNVNSSPSGDGSLYTASAVYNDGTNGVNLSSNEFCIYRGTSSTATMTGLVNGTTYNIKIFARKGSDWSMGILVSGIPVTIFSGDFRSKQNGNWTSTSTWEQYSGGVWVAATTFPNSPGSDVIIQAGTTVIVDGPGPYALKTLTVSTTGKLYSNNTSASTNIYLTVYGNIYCNGILGNSPLNDNLAFNIDGSSCTISGTGIFTTSRIRKYYNVNSVTALTIDMNITTQWSTSAAIYNGNTNTTAFNMTINAGRTVTVSNGGHVSIHGSSGTGFNNSYGTYNINGTLTITGTLILVNSNNNALYPSTINIGGTGVINTAQINAGASGLSGSKFSIANGGLLNLTGMGAFTSFSTTNNTIIINAGSTIQYSAAGAQNIETSFLYSNLTISGSGIKSSSNNVSVGNILLLSGGTYSQTGFTTTISAGGTVTGNGGDFAAGTAGGTISFTGNGTISGSNAMNFYNLNINSGTVISTLSNCVATNLNLVGGIFSIGPGNQFNIASGGSVNVTSGDFSPGVSGGILNFNGSGIFTGNCNPYHVFISGGVNFGSGTVTIQNGGSLRINNGGYVDTNGPNYASGSTLVYNTGNVYTASSEWYALFSSGRGVPWHVQIGLNTINNSGLSFGSSNAWRQCRGNFIISPASGGSGYSFTMGNAIGGDLRVAGDWQFNNGSFTPNDRCVTFNGTTNQSITGNLPTTFGYLTIANTGSAGSNTISQLKDPVTITKEFLLSAGYYNTGIGNSLVFNIGANLIHAGGDFINSPAAGLVWLKGSNAVTGTPYLYDVSIGSGAGSTPVTFTNNATIHHYCTINNQGAINPAAPKYAVGSTLIYNPGGVYDRSIEWGQLNPLEPGYPHHVVVQNGTTLNLGTYAPANLEIGGDLSIGTSTSNNNKVTMNALSQPLKIAGNLFIGDNASSANELVLSSAAGGDLEISGNFTRYGSGNYFTYGNRAVIFKGTSNASVNAVAQKFYKINMQKTGSGDLTLNCPVTIENNAEFTTGKINSGSTNLITFEQSASISGNPSSSSYINGPAAKQYSSVGDEFTFPLGKAGASPVYNPCGITPVSIAGFTTFNAEYFIDPLQQQTLMGEFLLGITRQGYWNISNSNNSSSARVKLFYTNPGAGNWIYYDASASSAPYYFSISDPCETCNVGVVQRKSDINSWTLTSDPANFNSSLPEYRYYTDNGFIYSAPLSSFSPFSIGFSYHVILLLPVKLLSFRGHLSGTNGRLEWKVDNTKGLAGFELQYSPDGRNFKMLASVKASNHIDYSYLHGKLVPGNNFYRLLVKEKNGRASQSQVVILNYGKPKTEITGLLNNPVNENVIPVIHSASGQKAKAIITDVSGRLISREETQLLQGQNHWRIPVPFIIAPGIYFIKIETADGVSATMKFTRQ